MQTYWFVVRWKDKKPNFLAGPFDSHAAARQELWDSMFVEGDKSIMKTEPQLPYDELRMAASTRR